jgi:hypothetical protein
MSFRPDASTSDKLHSIPIMPLVSVDRKKAAANDSHEVLATGDSTVHPQERSWVNKIVKSVNEIKLNVNMERNYRECTHRSMHCNFYERYLILIHLALSR